MGANAQTAVPAFVAGEVLTAAEMTQVNTGIPVFATTVTRDAAFGGAGEKVLAEGQFAYIEATNTTQYYDGAAWQSVGVSPGLVLITNQTIGSAVGSVTVTGAFSTTYDNYKIVVTGGVGSTNQVVKLTLGSTATGYYAGVYYQDYGVASIGGIAQSNQSSFLYAGAMTTNTIDMNCEIRAPFLAKQTVISGTSAFTTTSNTVYGYNGYLNDTTSYTAFTLTPNSGTMTGGTISVYGYAKA